MADKYDANPSRTMSALVVGACAGAVPYVVLTTIVTVAWFSFNLWLTFSVWAIATFAGLVGNFTIGLAWHLHRIRTGQCGILGYVVAGVLFGACCGALFGALLGALRPEHVMANTNGWAGAFAIYGLISTSVFWLFRRPDRDPPNPTTSSS